MDGSSAQPQALLCVNERREPSSSAQALLRVNKRREERVIDAWVSSCRANPAALASGVSRRMGTTGSTLHNGRCALPRSP